MEVTKEDIDETFEIIKYRAEKCYNLCVALSLIENDESLWLNEENALTAVLDCIKDEALTIKSDIEHLEYFISQ